MNKAAVRVGVETQCEACGCDSSAKRRSVPRGTVHRFRVDDSSANSGKTSRSSGKLAQEVGFVHAVLEGFAAVDEDDGDFVGELAAQLVVAVDVDVLPGEAAAAVQFGEGLFDDLAEVTSFAGVDHDLAGLDMAVSLAIVGRVCSSGCRASLGWTAGAAVPT